jgi:hypothetical protein
MRLRSVQMTGLPSLPKILLPPVILLTSFWLLQHFVGTNIFKDGIKLILVLPITTSPPTCSRNLSEMADILLPSVLLPSDNPASTQFSAWLVAFNSHDHDTLLAYHDAYFPLDVAISDVGTIDREIGFSNHTGGFDIIDVLDSSPGNTAASINVLLREKNRPQYARAVMEVDTNKESHPVTKFDINPTHTPIKFVPHDRKDEFERALAPLTPTRRRAVVKEISDVVREQYIFPEVGEKMITDLEAKVQENGDYDCYEESEAFAQRLTDDMHAISGDGHVHIMFSEPPPHRNDVGDHSDDDEQGRGRPENLFDELRHDNFGFGVPSTESIQDKRLGYLPINAFVPSTPDITFDSAAIRKEIGGIISSIADTDALIIDLRNNGGGQPDTVAFVVSYFVDGDAPIHLNDMVDRQGAVKYSYSTLPASSLPEGTARFGGSKPLFVLTSKGTVSGGEEMAYDLQALKRAHAIIGDGAETTAGAAHPVMNAKSICTDEFGKNWWVAAVPDMRPVNAVTGANWEGVGVKSDVVVEKGDDAKALARRMAMEALGLHDIGVSAREHVP